MVALLAIEKASVVAAPRSTFTHPEEWIDAFFGTQCTLQSTTVDLDICGFQMESAPSKLIYSRLPSGETVGRLDCQRGIKLAVDYINVLW
jgi:hypothetical protein